MTSTKTARGPSRWRDAALAFLPVFAALLLGQLATLPNLSGWYAELVKPPFNPPNWIFGPVWTALYVLMTYAVWRILQARNAKGRGIALALFFAQLSLNALWSWCFFGLQSPLAGLFNIVPQWLLILATAYRFSRIDRIAALCLLPLTFWVAFAAILNFSIWRLNG